MKYLVTSATGDLAGKAVEHLKKLVAIEEIAVTVRSIEKAQHLVDAGIDVRVADFLNKEDLVKAFTDIDRVLFISSGDLSTRSEQQANVVEALKEAGVKFVVYTSAPNAQESTAVVAPDHKLTENLIKDAGIDYTFARNNWYLENEAFVIQATKNSGSMIYSAQEGKTGWAIKDDYAEAAVRILVGLAPKQEIYELGGKPITYKELAEIVSAAIGKEVEAIASTDEQFTEQLTQLGLPDEVAGFFTIVQRDIREGALDVESSDLEKALGRKPTSFDEVIKVL